jgi:hypothetical protein
MYRKKKKITPLKLSDEARNELELRKKKRGTSFIQSVEDAIFGRDRFNPLVESEIDKYRQAHKCSRPEAVEAMLIEAIAAKTRGPTTIVSGGFELNDGIAAAAAADDIAKRNPGK